MIARGTAAISCQLLVAIDVSGRINASGGSGAGGIAEPVSGGAGGGGGPGGMIGRESARITVSGSLFANGAGGGGGTGDPMAARGQPGSNPASALVAAPGSNGGSNGGGRGGSGSSGALAGANADDATGIPETGGSGGSGGGGGGGGGVIHLFGAASVPGSATISPPRSDAVPGVASPRIPVILLRIFRAKENWFGMSIRPSLLRHPHEPQRRLRQKEHE